MKMRFDAGRACDPAPARLVKCAPPPRRSSGGAGCLKLDCKYPLVPLVVMAAFLVVYLVGLHRVALAARRHALNAAVRARASALRWAPTVLCLLLLLVRAVYVGGFSKQTWQQQFSG